MRFGGIVLATVLVLSGCSSDPAPKEPDPSKPATTTTTPAVAVPTLPPQASEDSPEGAAAFVKHYVDVFNYAAATGDVEELSRLSSPTCDGCQRYISKFQSIYSGGDRIAEKLWKLSDDDLTVRGKTRVTAVINVNEGSGGTKKYWFNFDLSEAPPFVLQDMTIGGRS
jgi:hypothetical protein